MTIELFLGPGGRVDVSGDAVLVAGPGYEVRPQSTPGLADALQRLTEGTSEDRMCQDVLDAGDPEALFSLFAVLRPLESAGAIQRRLKTGERVLATLTPHVRDFHFDPTPPDPSERRRLSRFAFLYRDDDGLRLQSPLGRASLRLDDSAAVAATLALTTGQSMADLAARVPDLSFDDIAGLLTLLQNTAALVDEGETERVRGAERAGAPGGWWEFHDLLFHMRSRRGRHDRPYGGTYPHGADAPAPPLIRPRRSGQRIALARPDLDALRAADDPFTDVLERRRSIRTYGVDPISLAQLGEFLYRALRYQRVLTGQGVEHALRPSPAGGALHELDVHVVVHRCRDLEPGVYDYDPAEHELVRLAGTSRMSDYLLRMGAATAAAPEPPDAYFVVSARCERVYWKYESMAYALILKNLGALYATMYLVATAMRLAPCALGGGDSELAARVCALDPLEEPVVGEFLLGSGPPEQP